MLPDQQQKGFIKSIQNNDVKAVERALAAKPSLVNITCNKTTPLVEAVKKNHVTIVQLLLTYEANVNKVEPKFHETPLFYAISKKANDDILDILLKKADVNKKVGSDQRGALHHAIAMGNETAVRKIACHPNVTLTLQDSTGNTPLHIAVEENNTNMVLKIAGKLKKPDFNIQNGNGLIPENVNTAESQEAIRAVKAVRALHSYNRRSLIEQESMIELYSPPRRHSSKSHSMSMEHDPGCSALIQTPGHECGMVGTNTGHDVGIDEIKVKLDFSELNEDSRHISQSSPNFNKISKDSAPNLCGDITCSPGNTNHVCSAAGILHHPSEDERFRSKMKVLPRLDEDQQLPNIPFPIGDVPAYSMPNLLDISDTTKIDTSTPKIGSGHVDVPSPSMARQDYGSDSIDAGELENSHQGHNPIKPFQLKRRKVCFILSNIVFSGHDPLEGYKFDVDNIIDTFEGLGFVIKHEQNKSADQMRDIFEDWSEGDFSDVDCMVSFILSHGGEHGVIFGTDGNVININDIQSIWGRCWTLRGTPKLIFLQACRGTMRPVVVEEEEYSTAGPSFTEDSKFVDAFVYYATSEGFSAYVSKVKGTTFIQNICDMLKKSGERYSLSQLVTLVNKMVSGTILKPNKRTKIAQAPEAVYTLRSDFFFGKYRGEGGTNVDGNVTILERYEVKERNPCFILTNTSCKMHESQCENFKLGKGMIEKTFSDLNFEIEAEENLKGDGIAAKFKKLKKRDYAKKDCVVCVVLSCGGVSGDLAVVYGSDGRFICVDTMIKGINDSKSLRGKPKLFFVVINKCNQTLFTSGDKEYQEAGGSGRAKCTDTLVYYVVVKTGEACTLFLTKLCEVLSEFARSKEYRLVDVILKVNELCGESSEIIPEVCHTLTREVYFKYTGAGCEEEGVGTHKEESYALSERTRMGSIPVETNTPDNRKVVIPDDGNDAGHVTLLELTRKEGLPANILSEHLTTSDIDRLEDCLEIRDPSGELYWELLCMKLNDCDDIRLAKNTIELWKTPGGSNTGKSILQVLVTREPLFKVHQFIDVAGKCRRNDICEFLKEHKDSGLTDLPLLVRKELEVLCSLGGISKDWRRLAEECNIGDCINKIASQCEDKVPPVKQMFQFIKQRYPHLALSCIVEKLYKLNINEAAETLTDIIKDKAKLSK